MVDGPVYITPFGRQLRFASVGEFAGWDTKPDSEIDASLRQYASRLFPSLSEEIRQGRIITGLRCVGTGVCVLSSFY